MGSFVSKRQATLCDDCIASGRIIAKEPPRRSVNDERKRVSSCEIRLEGRVEVAETSRDVAEADSLSPAGNRCATASLEAISITKLR